MRKAATLAMLIIAFAMAGTTERANGRSFTSSMHKQIVQLNRSIWSTRGTLNFFQHHPWLLHRKATKQIANREVRLARHRLEVMLPTVRRLRAIAYVQSPHIVHDWLYNAFICIHGGEGSWSANTGNNYYGGLQEDLGFQATYGSEFMHRWGTADKWPPWAQIIAAERAYHSGRGFSPWPNTARICGLFH